MSHGNFKQLTSVMPHAFTRIPGLAQLSYATVANSYVTRGAEMYLDDYLVDLKETLQTADRLRDFSDAALVNAQLALENSKPELDVHFDRMVNRPGAHSALLVAVNDQRVLWEHEYD